MEISLEIDIGKPAKKEIDKLELFSKLKFSFKLDTMMLSLLLTIFSLNSSNTLGIKVISKPPFVI